MFRNLNNKGENSVKKEEIADEALRAEVAKLQVSGFPPLFASVEEAQKQLNPEQIATFQEFHQGVLNHQKLEGKGNVSKTDLLALRNLAQKAVMTGLLGIQTVRDMALNFGAIPDPEYNWKYFTDPFGNGQVSCWTCGSRILSKNVTDSVHFKEMRAPGAGGGEVKGRSVPYCPKCDTEPQGGVVYE